MFDIIRRILEERDLTIVEEFELPARGARFAPIPSYLDDSPVGHMIRSKVEQSGGLWRHQSLALEKLGSGENVVVSTGTASGKSLIFRSTAFHRILSSPNDRILVFYPLKALAADQLIGWKDAAASLQLSEDIIGRIDGTVPVVNREGILNSSRIVIMTPDVCHAWLMSNLANPTVKEFLRNLAFFILDEAHTLEGVFGSNFAFLFRRILAARNSLLSAEERGKLPNVFAATATIANPSEHLKLLTGLVFVSIGEQDDGSPHHRRRCIHVASPPRDELSITKMIQVELLTQSEKGGFITFVDSRKATEILSFASNEMLSEILPGPGVLPYRAGLDKEDRKIIEQKLREGSLRGVVSTSALELGIDIPHLQVGMNIGVPATRKAYRQRLGRVGRSGLGTFVIVAEHNAFTKYGTTYEQYHEMSVEPSYLYLENRFMQYAHARCIIDEQESLGSHDRTSLPTRIDWPNGFNAVFKTALPGGNRPREFDVVAMLGGDSPHRSYPLRNVGEMNFKICFGDCTDPIGEINLSQALRECYPGATYYHFARPYKVLSWHTHLFQPMIKVKAVTGAASTRPRVRVWINAGLTQGDLVDNNLRRSENGFIAECQMQITEKVEGYQEGETGTFKSYQELRERNPNMRPSTRQFRTTGVLVCIQEEWFRKGDIKQFLADTFRDLFCREFSVLPQDIGAASTNIAVTNNDGHIARSDCFVLFDQTYGSLRLTERAYQQFGMLIERLYLAVENAALGENGLSLDLVQNLRNFELNLVSQEASAFPAIDQNIEPGLMQVFSAGSKVELRQKGALFTEVEIIMPAILPDGSFWYQVKCVDIHLEAEPAKQWVNPEYLEPSANGDEWGYALWNPVTQEYV